MAKAIPIIITNTNILLYDKASEEFKPFSLQGVESQPNIPFYHSFAKKIAESQHYFKEFLKQYYPKKANKIFWQSLCRMTPARLKAFS